MIVVFSNGETSTNVGSLALKELMGGAATMVDKLMQLVQIRSAPWAKFIMKMVIIANCGVGNHNQPQIVNV
jgi:hypothetical protein